MAFTPSDRLTNRTFIGLLTAQFLAAFNDQAIHAAAMFFAFHQHLMTEATAISLMPILFYAPWAVFCTLAGYYADRYSKRHSLVFWKIVEVAICAVALLGFHLGAAHNLKIGPIIVLACVFGMGMHSAFFVPAKYGVMPEILQPQLLSRGNGLLESLSFLAVILGTVFGGVLSYVFNGEETYIGVVLLILAVIGAAASFLIETMPAANPTRPFPKFVYGPLYDSLKTLLGSRPLLLATVGIAFFTFVVAFMRATVYMLGESQTPRWREDETSAIVGCTALGIGLGAPLAGWLSGRKIELGLIPLGGLGMTFATLLVSLTLHWTPGLVACIIVIGFFTGFYLVPLYTLLQHRAPKKSKGDSVAVSNFVNVTGAILASLVFFACTKAFLSLGLAKPIPFDAGRPATLIDIHFEEGRPTLFTVSDRPAVAASSRVDIRLSPLAPVEVVDANFPPEVVVFHGKNYGKDLYILAAPGEERPVVFDKSNLPGYLFAGGGLITLLTLGLLVVILPDLPARAAWVTRTLRQPRLRAAGTHHVPLTGAVVLVSNAANRADLRQIVSATDRPISLVEGDADVVRAARVLKRGGVVLLSHSAWPVLAKLTECAAAGVVPVAIEFDKVHGQPRVAFGELGGAPVDVDAAIRAAAQTPDDGGH